MRRQQAALERRDTLAADMKSKFPTITIGLDLGDKKHAVCVLNHAGEIEEDRSITNHRESLRRLSQKYPGSRIAMEVGQHSPWTSRFFESLGHEVIVANPRKLRAIYTSTRKSDQSDA
jgi:transposase